MLAVSLENEASSAWWTDIRIAEKLARQKFPVRTVTKPASPNASFVGWGPVETRNSYVYIWLEKPTSSPCGSVVAAPVFKEVVEELVVLMKLPPDSVRLQIAQQ